MDNIQYDEKIIQLSIEKENRRHSGYTHFIINKEIIIYSNNE